MNIRRGIVADEIVEHRRDREVQLGILPRKCHAQPRSRRAQLAERLFLGRLWLQSSIDLQVVLVVHRFALGRERDRHPEFFAIRRVVERRRHHADDVVGPFVERDLTAHDCRIATESPCPKSVAQHDDLFTPGLILLLREDAAVHGRKVEYVEVTGRDPAADHPLGIARVRQVEARELLGGNGAERADRLDPVDEVAG